MKIWMKTLICISLSLMFLFTCIGYAALTTSLRIGGSADVTPVLPDIYISNVTPISHQGVTVMSTSGTVMSATVTGSGTATFTVTVTNISDKIYVYERVIDGVETGFEGVYAGDDITYKVSGISTLDEVAPNGGTRTFQVDITVPRGVTTNMYILYFKFVEKQGTEILPGDDDHDVTFKYNNGQPDLVQEYHLDDFVQRPENPTRNGYEFIGWYTDATYTTAWNFEADRVQGEMTLYAGWSYIDTREYSVTFKPNNGDADIAITVPRDSLITPPTSPTMDGHIFTGWYTDQSCTNAWNFDTDTVTANIVLYGGWEEYVPPPPPECGVVFKPNNGTPDVTVTVIIGERVPEPQPPVMNGYVFLGWYTDDTFTTLWDFDSDRAEGNMTLYGAWEKETIKYTVIFDANNGTANSSVTVEEGALVPRPQTPVLEGYTFIGWYIDEDVTTAWNFDMDKPVSDMTLYGAWEKTVAPTPGDQYHNDFLGLVEALLSTSNNCLNHNDLIFDAVMESLTSKKRPKEDAPILHCSVNSISGGTMSAISTFANSKLTANLHFIFEVDPDPAYQDSRLRLYMYYGDDCVNANNGDEIMVYLQIISRDSKGIWFADGTYIGRATVGDYFGGGNSGKDVKTISPYTWKAGAPTE